MSAAEKLKALDEALTESPWFYEAGIPEGGDRTGSVWAQTPALELVMSKPHVVEAQRLLALRNALPQIVAVVEAAEAGEDALRMHGRGPELIVARHALYAALAALDEALS